MKKRAIIYSLMMGLLCSCLMTGDAKKEPQIRFNPLLAIVQFYRGPLDHLSSVRQGECQMYPSCSEYSRQALEKYGFFMGAMIAADRLMRCGRDEMTSAPLILVHGKWKHYDPLERNISWLGNNDIQPETRMGWQNGRYKFQGP